MNRASLIATLEALPPHLRQLNATTIAAAQKKTRDDATEFDARLSQVAEARDERQLHQQIAGMLRRRGIAWIGHGSTAHRSKYTVGWPDFVIPLPNGRVLFWEVKHGDGKLSPEQVECLDWLRDAGQLVHVIRSYAEAVETLEKFWPEVK
jgi:hypothetical protein